MTGMNIKWINGYAYLWFSRAEWPPKGKLLSMKKIVGSPVTTQDQAEKILKSVSKNKLEQKLIELEGGNRISIERFADEYVEGVRSDFSDSSLRMDRAVLRYLQDVTGKTTLRLINDDDLVTFKNYYLSRISPETLKGYFRRIRAALNYAAEQGYIKKVPKIPSVKAPKKQPRPIPLSDLEKILNYAKVHNFEVWRYAQFSVWTGCRQEECIRLQYQDITKYDEPTPAGVAGVCRITGKGNKERTAYLLPPAMEAIGEIKDIGPVFRQWTGTTVSHYFKRCVRKAGFETPRFHDLRHTAATRMVTAGIPLPIVQKILGHTDIRTTQIYADIIDKVVETEMGKML